MTSMPLHLCYECDNFVWDSNYDDDKDMCKECAAVGLDEESY